MAKCLPCSACEEPPGKPECAPVEHDQEQNEDHTWGKRHDKHQKQVKADEDYNSRRQRESSGNPSLCDEEGNRAQQPDHEQRGKQEKDRRDEFSLEAYACSRYDTEQGKASVSKPDDTEEHRSYGK